METTTANVTVINNSMVLKLLQKRMSCYSQSPEAILHKLAQHWSMQLTPTHYTVHSGNILVTGLVDTFVMMFIKKPYFVFSCWLLRITKDPWKERHMGKACTVLYSMYSDESNGFSSQSSSRTSCRNVIILFIRSVYEVSLWYYTIPSNYCHSSSYYISN